MVAVISEINKVRESKLGGESFKNDRGREIAADAFQEEVSYFLEKYKQGKLSEVRLVDILGEELVKMLRF